MGGPPPPPPPPPPPTPLPYHGTDIALTGGVGWLTIPVAFSRGDGTFTVTNDAAADFASWAQGGNVKVLAGNFYGHGIALTGGSGWATIPVARSFGDGTFFVTNDPAPDFAALAQGSNVKALAGDFNGDGNTDIALIGGAGWSTIPIAFGGAAVAQGGRGWGVTNAAAANFAGWAQEPSVQVLTGDFNGDGRTDIALVGGPGWEFIAVAFSNGDGTFRVTHDGAGDFSAWAQGPTVKALAGDFDGDGRTDIALTGGLGWDTIPVAYSKGDGTFRVVNRPAADFAGWAQGPTVKAFTGDFNGDGRTDIALTGGVGWNTIPVAFSNADGTVTVTNHGVVDFAGWAQGSTVTVLMGDFDADGLSDMALTGGVGWNTIPVAFSNGDGTFRVTNHSVTDFAGWAQGPTVSAHPTRLS